MHYTLIHTYKGAHTQLQTRIGVYMHKRYTNILNCYLWRVALRNSDRGSITFHSILLFILLEMFTMCKYFFFYNEKV